MPEPTQPPNSHGSQLLSGLQAVDLGGVESQTRQRRAAQRSREIASPALLLEPPAFLEFAIDIIFNVPAGPEGLQGGKAIPEGAGAH